MSDTDRSTIDAFYADHHGTREKNAVTSIAARFVTRLLSPIERPLSVLDVGCGDMQIGQQVAASIRDAAPTRPQVDVTGWDFSREAVAEARENGLDCRQMDVTVPLTKAEGPYDVVLFLEVLEHIVDTDTAMRNLAKVIAPEGLLLLSTPNLASWYNRIFLLMGLQPHCTEVSFEHRRFGNPLTERFIKGAPAGHLRLFTWRALKEFMAYHGWEILAAKGISNHREDLVSRFLSLFAPGLCGDICVVARRRA